MHNSCEKLSFLVVRLVNAELSSQGYWRGRRSQIVLKRRNTCLTQVVFREVLAVAEISNSVKKETLAGAEIPDDVEKEKHLFHAQREPVWPSGKALGW